MGVSVWRLIAAASLVGTCVGGPALAAAGVDLAWNECWPDGGASMHFFACDTNVISPVGVLVGSFVPSVNHPEFVLIEAIVDVATADPTLPDWWQLWYAGACRQTSLSADVNFSSLSMQSCKDAFDGRADVAGGLTTYKTYLQYTGVPEVFTPNGARIKMAFAVPTDQPIVAGQEYAAFMLRVDGRNSSGPLACGGCASPTCLLLTEIRVVENTAGTYEVLDTPVHNQAVGWQCGLSHIAPGTGLDLPQISCEPPSASCVTASRNRTWGSIKSLWR